MALNKGNAMKDHLQVCGGVGMQSLKDMWDPYMEAQRENDFNSAESFRRFVFSHPNGLQELEAFAKYYDERHGPRPSVMSEPHRFSDEFEAWVFSAGRFAEMQKKLDASEKRAKELSDLSTRLREFIDGFDEFPSAVEQEIAHIDSVLEAK